MAAGSAAVIEEVSATPLAAGLTLQGRLKQGLLKAPRKTSPLAALALLRG